MRPIQSGIYRHIVTILSPTVNRNEYGENTPALSVVARVRGSIKTLSGRQLALAQANTITSTASHEIRIRSRENLKITYTLGFGGTYAPSFLSLDTASFSALTTDEFLVLSGGGTLTGARLFAINTINDVEELGREIILTCTEIFG